MESIFLIFAQFSIWQGLLNQLEPQEIVAVLSALVFQEKNNSDDLDLELPQRIVSCCKDMKTLALRLGMIQREKGLEMDPQDYCEGALKFGLVHCVYEWALGVPFRNICELTDVQEGSIVRCITRLDELCRDIRNCAR
jgi:antiviral helicase SKI2